MYAFRLNELPWTSCPELFRNYLRNSPAPSTSLLYFRRFPALELSRARSDEERDWHRLCVIRPLSYAVTPAKNSFVFPSCSIHRHRTISSFLLKISRRWIIQVSRRISSVFVLSPLLWFAERARRFRGRSSNVLCVSSAARTFFFFSPRTMLSFTRTYVSRSRAMSLISRVSLVRFEEREGERNAFARTCKLVARLLWKDSKMMIRALLFRSLSRGPREISTIDVSSEKPGAESAISLRRFITRAKNKVRNLFARYVHHSRGRLTASLKRDTPSRDDGDHFWQMCSEWIMSFRLIGGFVPSLTTCQFCFSFDLYTYEKTKVSDVLYFLFDFGLWPKFDEIAWYLLQTR